MNNAKETIRNNFFRKIVLPIIILAIVDFILIWLWVTQMDPDPIVSVGLLFLVPAIFVVNIIIAIIFLFIKGQYSALFLINAVIPAILLYILFVNGIERNQRSRLESWDFKINDTTYKISHWKIENTFSISQSTNPGSSWGFLDGSFEIKDKDYYLTTDSTQYVIRDGILYDFRNKGDIIKLTKVDK
jgi:hypothetical protein